MKKARLIMILIALCLSFAACGTKKERQTAKVEEKKQEKQTSNDNQSKESTNEEKVTSPDKAEDEQKEEVIEEETNEETDNQNDSIQDSQLTYIDVKTYDTKEANVIKDINKRDPESKEVSSYLAEFADKVRNADPQLLDYLAWPEDKKEDEELARIKIASILNDEEAKSLWKDVFKNFKIIDVFMRSPFNVTGKPEERGKSKESVFILNDTGDSLINTLNDKELAEFAKKYPYRKFNISDKATLLPVYKDLLSKNSKYSPVTIDGRPLELGDFNNDGHASINGASFMENNIFFFPVKIEETDKKPFWSFHILEKISEFKPLELSPTDDKELIEYKELYTKGKLSQLYDTILKNSESKGFSFTDDSEIRESIKIAEKHYKKLDILPRMNITTPADVYGEQKEEDIRTRIHTSGLTARSYTPKTHTEIVQYLPYQYTPNSSYYREKFTNENNREASSAEAVFIEIFEDLKLENDRPTELISEIKTK